MKRLFLLRHAKAVSGDAKTEDHDRELNSRGEGDSSRMGAQMHHRRYVPDLALSSTSARTVETWDRLAPEFDPIPKVEFLPQLYLASAKAILKVVQSAADGIESLLILGHNPGLEECGALLARKPETKDERIHLERMREKFPTCALAVLDFDISHWREVEVGTGMLADFLRPKDL